MNSPANNDDLPLPTPRELAWRGVVAASGLCLSIRSGTLSEAEARRRILALWEPGVSVYALDGGDLFVILPKPRMMRAENAPGTPAVRTGSGVLSTAPLSVEDARRLRSSPPSANGSDYVARVRGGAWYLDTLDASCAVDVAAWLNLRSVSVVPDAVSLGAPTAPVKDGLPPADFDPRTVYGKVANASPDLAGVVAALKGLKGKTGQPQAGKGAGTGLGGTLSSFAERLLARMQPPVFERTGSGGVGVSKPSGPSVEADDPWAWLKWGAARLAGLTGLSAIVGQKQADYIRKMLDLFDRGDLEQALRHAIPLDGNIDEVLKRLPPSLFVPTPRMDLTIRPGGVNATSSINTTRDLQGHLKALYRQAFERLEREGRIDEAAFVLAELLKNDAEAVSFLEKHRRFKLAADMAEARKLSNGLVVRLRFLAGERARAVAFARRTGAWGDAIWNLERTPEFRDEGQALRLEWAVTLADAGDYGQAIEVAVLVAQAQNLVLAWMGRIVDGGGVPAARMSARRLARFPEGDPAWRTNALALLEEEAPARAQERRAFIAEITRPGLWTYPQTLPLQRQLARAAIRTVGRDTTLGSLPPTNQQYDSLLQTAADPILKADVPSLRDLMSVAPAAVRHRALRERAPDEPPFTVAANDVGLVPVEDAAYLPSGRTLIALGERGVRLLAPDGHIVREWPSIPAHRLVIADSGNVALALARRGSLWRLTRLDIVTGAATPWCDAEISAFAPDSDGSLWMVALPNGGDTQVLTAIDLQGSPDRLSSLWRTPLEEGGKFVAIARSAASCVALSLRVQSEAVPFTSETEIKVQWQRWTLDMPSLVMRDRYIWAGNSQMVGAAPKIVPAPLISADGCQGAVSIEPGAAIIREVNFFPKGAAETNTFQTELKLYGERSAAALWLGERGDNRRRAPAFPVMGSGWLADIQHTAGDEPPTVVLQSLIDARPNVAPATLIRLRVQLAGAENVAVRIFGGHLTVWDDRGRVLVFDLTTGDVAADLRVR